MELRGSGLGLGACLDGAWGFAKIGDADSLRLLSWSIGPSTGFDIGTLDVDGSTLLHCACENGQLSVVQYLLNELPQILKVSINDNQMRGTCLDVDARSFSIQNGGTCDMAIHRAARCGAAEVIDILLDFGTDINARDEEGRTPLMRAAQADGCFQTSTFDAVVVLLSRGADVSATVDIDDSEFVGYDALMLNSVSMNRKKQYNGNSFSVQDPKSVSSSNSHFMSFRGSSGSIDSMLNQWISKSGKEYRHKHSNHSASLYESPSHRQQIWSNRMKHNTRAQAGVLGLLTALLQTTVRSKAQEISTDASKDTQPPSPTSRVTSRVVSTGRYDWDGDLWRLLIWSLLILGAYYLGTFAVAFVDIIYRLV